jgi:ubiquinone/menaquinone biosynthesis C-methylase UbiE
LCDQGGLKDEELYRRVHKLLHHNILQGLPGFEVACQEFTIKLHALKKSSYRSDHRSDKLVEILQRTLGQSEVDSIKTVLDIGCADGRITSAIGANLQIEPGNIHGCDVYENNENSDTSSNEQSNDDSFSDSTHSTDFTHSTNTTQSSNTTNFSNSNSNITCSKNSNKIRSKNYVHHTLENPGLLPYADNSMDLIVAMMSLHHIEKLKSMLNEIKRVLKPGGYFFIREHNVCTWKLQVILDVVHGFYQKVWPAQPDDSDFSSEFLNYKSAGQWTNIIESAGFIELYNDSQNEGFWIKRQNGRDRVVNPLRYYYALYKAV